MKTFEISYAFVFLTVLVLLVTVSVYVYGGAQSALPRRSFGEVLVNKNLQTNGIIKETVYNLSISSLDPYYLTFSNSRRYYFELENLTTEVYTPSLNTIKGLFDYSSAPVGGEPRTNRTQLINFGRIINNTDGNVTVNVRDSSSIDVFGATVSGGVITLASGSSLNLTFQNTSDNLRWFTT